MFVNTTRLGIMIDIETLDTVSTAITTQIAFVAFDLDDPTIRISGVDEYLPIQPQIELGRTLSGSTLLWWMQQSDEARAGFQRNEGDDYDELAARVRSVMRKIDKLLANSQYIEYEIWARGPQFDINIIESLATKCAIEVPWRYDRVRDLRTLMAAANLSAKDVERDPALRAHVAIHDCDYQIIQYGAAMNRIVLNTGVA